MDKKNWKIFKIIFGGVFVALFVLGLFYFNSGWLAALIFSTIMTSLIGTSAYMDATRGRRR